MTFFAQFLHFSPNFNIFRQIIKFSAKYFSKKVPRCDRKNDKIGDFSIFSTTIVRGFDKNSLRRSKIRKFWFIIVRRLQGYTNKAIPSHRDVQKCLVDIGDKPSSFVGSKQWIGSTEVGFVLETLFGVTVRILCASNGDVMSELASDLVHHFETQGTPVMIGE